MNLTKDEAIALLRKVMPFKYTDIGEEGAKRILSIIEQQQLKPIDEGLSLHAWSADYIIDGQRYQVFGELGHHQPSSVMIVEQWLVD